MYPEIRMLPSERAVVRFIVQRIASIAYRGNTDAYSENVDRVMEDLFDVSRFMKKMNRGIRDEQKMIALCKEVGINPLWKLARGADNFKAFGLLVATDAAIVQEKKRLKKYEAKGSESKASKSKKLIKKYKKSYDELMKQLRDDLGVKKTGSNSLLKEINQFLDDRQDDDATYLFGGDDDYYDFGRDDTSVESFLRQQSKRKKSTKHGVMRGAFVDELEGLDDDDDDDSFLLDDDDDYEDDEDDSRDEILGALAGRLKELERSIKKYEAKATYASAAVQPGVPQYQPQPQPPQQPRYPMGYPASPELQAVSKKVDSLAVMVNSLVGALLEDDEDPMAEYAFGTDAEAPEEEVYPKISGDKVQKEITTEEDLLAEIQAANKPETVIDLPPAPADPRDALRNPVKTPEAPTEE